MTQEEFIKEYPESEEQILLLGNDFTLSFDLNGVSVFLPGSDDILLLSHKHLGQLDNGKKISKLQGLFYYEHCGFSYNNYSEFFITIKHPDYFYIEGVSEWPAPEPLKFKIEDVLITIGSPSNLIVLLMEPYYLDSDIYPGGFSSLASIRIASPQKINHQEYFHKALFYLNSYYLKAVGMYAALKHVENKFDDPLGLYYGTKEPEEEFKKITRKRIRKRKNLQSSEPLILYNYAQTLEKEEQFLSLYRILEFFFTRNKLQLIENLRYNTLIPNEDILKIVELRNELSHLTSLLDEITTLPLKTKLLNYAKAHNLIKNQKFTSLCQELYTFRNSIVHAKEEQILSAKISNPFDINTITNKWIYIIRELSEYAIKQLNEASI